MVNKIYRGHDAEVIDLKQRSQNIRAGKTYYVNAGAGTTSANGLNGLDWDNAFARMTDAFAVIASGDTIMVNGNVREQLTTPAGVFDCAIIGAGNRPRHADAHTTNGGYSGATWKAPASGSTANPLLIIQQQGWRVSGITFQITGSATVCIRLHKTDDSGDDERDGGHAEISYNKFQGDPATPAGIGVQTNGTGFWKLHDNMFLGLVTGVAKTGAAGGQVGWGEIVGNRFSDNTNGIVSPLYRFLIRNNYFLPAHTIEFDLTGGAGNIWEDNIFHGNSAFETNTAATGDFIIGRNWAGDTGSADVDDTTGFVSAAPDGS